VVPASYDPGTGEQPELTPFNIRVLFGDSPSKSRTLNWRMTTCSRPSVLRCEGIDGGAGEIMVIGEGQVVARDGLAEVQAELGSARQAAALWPLIEDAIENDTYRGFGGLPLVVAVQVWTDVEEVNAGKRIPIWLPIPKAYPEIMPNEMPSEPVVLFDVVQAMPGEVVKLRGDSIPVDVLPTDPSLRETYYVPNFEGGVEELRENWTYAWFTTKGWFSPERTGGWDPILKEEGDTDTTLKLAEGTELGRFKVVCVVRDGRGGETWTVVDAEYLGE